MAGVTTALASAARRDDASIASKAHARYGSSAICLLWRGAIWRALSYPAAGRMSRVVANDSRYVRGRGHAIAPAPGALGLPLSRYSLLCILRQPTIYLALIALADSSSLPSGSITTISLNRGSSRNIVAGGVRCACAPFCLLPAWATRATALT